MLIFEELEEAKNILSQVQAILKEREKSESVITPSAGNCFGQTVFEYEVVTVTSELNSKDLHALLEVLRETAPLQWSPTNFCCL